MFYSWYPCMRGSYTLHIQVLCLCVNGKDRSPKAAALLISAFMPAGEDSLRFIGSARSLCDFGPPRGSWGETHLTAYQAVVHYHSRLRAMIRAGACPTVPKMKQWVTEQELAKFFKSNLQDIVPRRIQSCIMVSIFVNSAFDRIVHLMLHLRLSSWINIREIQVESPDCFGVVVR
jgi:hypothetical protein